MNKPERRNLLGRQPTWNRKKRINFQQLLYTVFRTKGHYCFPISFMKVLQSLWFLTEIFLSYPYTVTFKWPTTPIICGYTTLWNPSTNNGLSTAANDDRRTWISSIRMPLTTVLYLDVRCVLYRYRREQFDIQLACTALQSSRWKDLLRWLHPLYCSSQHHVRYVASYLETTPVSILVSITD